MNLLTWILIAGEHWWSPRFPIKKSPFDYDPADCIPVFIVLAVGGLVAWGYSKYRQSQDVTQPCDDAQKLFRELCLAHQLDRHAQSLLKRLATAFKLQQPAEVFVTQQAFDPQRLPAHLSGERAQIAELGKRLFR